MRDLRGAHRKSVPEKGSDLIASDRVEGTKVFRPDGEKIGRVDHFMVGKRSGLVDYVVMSFGGFLGMGKELRPIPWEALDYDSELGGYVVSAEEDVLRTSPYFEDRNEPTWDHAYGAYVYGHWGLPY
jgi:hypothetical protein